MTDTPQHIKDLHLELWLRKTPEERLIQTVNDIDIMRKALRQIKIENNLPLGDLDPVGDYLKKKEQQKK